MKRVFWNKIADSYESEIFNVLKQDRKGLIVEQLDRFSRKTGLSIDFGCGTGNFLPLLSARFKKVIAADISPNLIQKAQNRHASLANITYLIKDLSRKNLHLPRADFALSVNAIIAPSLAVRNGIFDAIARHLKPGAALLLVVPSIESVLLKDYRLIEWNLKDGLTPGQSERSEFHARKKLDGPHLHKGLIHIDNVPTKHYLKEELITILERRRMKIIEISKIEYPWTTEFAAPPRWMQSPFPWDWLCVAKKLASS